MVLLFCTHFSNGYLSLSLPPPSLFTMWAHSETAAPEVHNWVWRCLFRCSLSSGVLPFYFFLSFFHSLFPFSLLSFSLPLCIFQARTDSCSWNPGPSCEGWAFPICKLVSHPFTRLWGCLESYLQLGADFPFASKLLCRTKDNLVWTLFLWVSLGCVERSGSSSPVFSLLHLHPPPPPLGC